MRRKWHSIGAAVPHSNLFPLDLLEKPLPGVLAHRPCQAWPPPPPPQLLGQCCSPLFLTHLPIVEPRVSYLVLRYVTHLPLDPNRWTASERIVCSTETGTKKGDSRSPRALRVSNCAESPAAPGLLAPEPALLGGARAFSEK